MFNVIFHELLHCTQAVQRPEQTKGGKSCHAIFLFRSCVVLKVLPLAAILVVRQNPAVALKLKSNMICKKVMRFFSRAVKSCGYVETQIQHDLQKVLRFFRRGKIHVAKLLMLISFFFAALLNVSAAAPA